MFKFNKFVFTILLVVNGNIIGQDFQINEYHPGYYELPRVIETTDSIQKLIHNSLQNTPISALQSLPDTMIVSLWIEYPGYVQSVIIRDSVQVRSSIFDSIKTVFSHLSIEYPDTSAGYPPNVWINLPVFKKEILYEK